MKLRRMLEERDAQFRTLLTFEERKQLPPWKAQVRYKTEEDQIVLKMHLEKITGEEAMISITRLMEAYYGRPLPILN